MWLPEQEPGDSIIPSWRRDVILTTAETPEAMQPDPTELLIRTGNRADAAALADLAARTFGDAFGADTPPDDMRLYLDENFSEAKQAAELEDPSMVTLIGEAGGRMVAYAQLSLDPPPPCVTTARPFKLERFYVDRTHHGSGIAPRLMQRVIEAARVRGRTAIWLTVWEINGRALRFYAKSGFTDVGRVTFMVGNDVQYDRVLVLDVAAT